MKKIIVLSLLCSSGCINPLSLSEVCTLNADCEIERGSYEPDDEKAYRSYLIETCKDETKDYQEQSAIYRCELEYVDYTNCYLKNYVDRCDYNDNEYDEYSEESQNINDNLCWKEYNRWMECQQY